MPNIKLQFNKNYVKNNRYIRGCVKCGKPNRNTLVAIQKRQSGVILITKAQFFKWKQTSMLKSDIEFSAKGKGSGFLHGRLLIGLLFECCFWTIKSNVWPANDTLCLATLLCFAQFTLLSICGRRLFKYALFI